ncbi:MAG: hypothetical protein FWD70_06770 [Desulfuromonadales bacterium]|nr:hypothetical protein [Desulfuromonadales bacterium]
MKKIMTCMMALLLAGCTYDLNLMPHDHGEMGHGKASLGDVTITIGHETYNGHYAYVRNGGTVFGTGGYATGMSFLVQGNIMAQSAEGNSLSCVFQAYGHQGVGECQTHGIVYDLQIH